MTLAQRARTRPRVVADLEARWKNAGLVWRPTDETYAAGMTADRLGVDLVTEDSDVRKIGHPWHVAAMTIAEFACALAACPERSARAGAASTMRSHRAGPPSGSWPRSPAAQVLGRVRVVNGTVNERRRKQASSRSDDATRLESAQVRTPAKPVRALVMNRSSVRFRWAAPRSQAPCTPVRARQLGGSPGWRRIRTIDRTSSTEPKATRA
jgi:hypothetical protein